MEKRKTTDEILNRVFDSDNHALKTIFKQDSEILNLVYDNETNRLKVSIANVADETARTIATEARTEAVTAQATADDALTVAEEALTSAGTAQAKAETAQTTAETAQSTANSKLGKTEKAADSSLLNGKDYTAFLGKTEKAADSSLLNSKKQGTSTGDVMSVGDFGFGIANTSNEYFPHADLNTFSKTSVNTITATPINTPLDSNDNVVLLTLGGGIGFSTQIASSLWRSRELYWRQAVNSNWSVWEKILSDDGTGFGVFGKADNKSSLGLSNRRWTTVFAATGTINTSDAREKTKVIPLTSAELNAAKQLAKEIGTYQFLSSVQDKGENARHHVGMTVQRAIEIMEENGLEPFSYGFICYDEWDAEYSKIEVPAVLDNDGNEIEPARFEQGELISDAGNRFSFRTDELMMFISRGIEARLTLIEEKL